MKRRELLRKTSTGLAVGIGATGVSGARRPDDGLPAEIEFEPSAARDALSRRTGLLDELAAARLIDGADLDGFDFETRLDSMTAGDGVAATTAVVGGSETELLTVSRVVDDGFLAVHLLPDGSDAFAVLRAGDGEVLETFGGFQSAVSPQPSCPPCYEEICTCTDDSCGYCCAWSCYCSCTCDPCPTSS